MLNMLPRECYSDGRITFLAWQMNSCNQNTEEMLFSSDRYRGSSVVFLAHRVDSPSVIVALAQSCLSKSDKEVLSSITYSCT